MPEGVSTDLSAQTNNPLYGLTFQHFWNIGLVFLLIGSFWGQFMLFEQHMTDFEREMRAEVAEIKGEVSEIKQEMGILEDGQVQLRLRVTKLEAQVNHLRDDIQEVKGDVKDVKRDIRHLLQLVNGDKKVAGAFSAGAGS